MHSQNGLGGTVVAPDYELGDFLPEQRWITLNGNRYLGWITTNKRYPRRIMARLDKLSRTYGKVIEPLIEPTVTMPQGMSGPDYIAWERAKKLQDAQRAEAIDAQQEAYNHYVTESIKLLVPSLLESEIELVDLTVCEKLLRELGFFPPLKDEEWSDTPTDGSDTEVKTEHSPLTGDTSLEDSPTSTPVTLTNDS